MPNYDPNAELRPWAAATDNISRAMMQLPALRSQLARQKNQDAVAAQVAQARITNLNAGADYSKARAAGETQDQGGDLKISDALRRLQVDANDNNAAADLMEGIGKSFRHHPKQTSEAIGMMMSTMLANRGSTNLQQMGVLQGGAASMANNQANVAGREKVAMETPLIVPNQATAVDKATGKPIAQGGFTIMPGGQRFDGRSMSDALTTTNVPVASSPPKPLPPKSSAAEQERLRLARAILAGDSPESITNKLSQFDAVAGRPTSEKALDATTAKAILQEVGGDKQKARELAKQRGYTF